MYTAITLLIGLLLGFLVSGVVYTILFHSRVSELIKSIKEDMDLAYNEGYRTGWHMADEAAEQEQGNNVEQYYQKEDDIIEP